MEITVTTLSDSFTLRVNPQDTVGTLKRLIQDKLGVDPVRQKLQIVNGQRIPLNDDSKLISYYSLQAGSQVSLLITEPPPIQVFLKNETGKTSTYDIKGDETVDNFKKRVQSREGVPVSQQRLIHEGKEMQEGKLADYNVRALSTIFMTMRLRGG